MADPTYRDAVTDLLGVLAYAELVAFERLAYDARMAPTLEDKAALARMASAEFGHYQVLERHLEGMGVGAEKAMAPFVVPLEAFHAQTPPSDWAESLVKAYVGDGIAADFYREIAQLLDPTARAWCSRCWPTPATPSSRSSGCGRPSMPIRPSPAGWRCGVGASSAKHSRKPRPCVPNATHWSRCWSAEYRVPAPTSAS